MWHCPQGLCSSRSSIEVENMLVHKNQRSWEQTVPAVWADRWYLLPRVVLFNPTTQVHSLASWLCCILCISGPPEAQGYPFQDGTCKGRHSSSKGFSFATIEPWGEICWCPWCLPKCISSWEQCNLQGYSRLSFCPSGKEGKAFAKTH